VCVFVCLFIGFFCIIIVCFVRLSCVCVMRVCNVRIIYMSYMYMCVCVHDFFLIGIIWGDICVCVCMYVCVCVCVYVCVCACVCVHEWGRLVVCMATISIFRQ